jgi:CRISPR-associated DxTHG motif protein
MSKVNIITFLGDRGALQTTYTHNGKEYIGRVFAEALRQFCEYDTMLVCVTERARENTWPVLEALGDSRIKAIDIPTGRSTEEMWQTFKIIAEQVNENDNVIFDITHGLRSLPFLVFLFAAYLKAAKNVTINAIYYGALELGNSRTGLPAPVIDLSEFVGMLDWLTATERFIEIGDGQALANLLKTAIPSAIELSNNPASRPIRSNLERAVNSIETISLALSLTRPIETMQSANRLEEILEQAESSFAERAKPFSLLSTRVVQEYGQFALEDPTDQAALAENLWLQLQMIEWYIERNRIVQAVTLAREWLISVLALRFDELIFDDKKGRKPVEDAINNAGAKRRSSPRPITPSRCDKKFEILPQAEELVNVWSQMTELRNDIAHVGMRLKPATALKLKQKVVSLYPQLQIFARELLPERILIE